ncbi:MAG: bifunctional shikimate kinase/3-dehydroquinate synthase [Armatimonadota bacterium]|nr:bifunctional shikimate kinase/3-dehydroquinate synthase [Armatimonadota bacterium]
MRSVALIGMPATGKSAVGRQLALVLGLPFSDTDEIIESREDAAIAEIFETRGEASFRALEAALIAEVTRAPGVVATGGGVVESEHNMQVLRDWGWIVALVASPEVLATRVGRADQWPLLRGGVIENLHRLWTRREAKYRSADLVVDVGQDDVEGVVRKILAFLAQREPAASVEVRPAHAPSYRAVVGEGILGLAGHYAQEAGLGGRVGILASPAANRRYGEQLCDALQGSGFAPVLIEIPSGESAKTWETAGRLCGRLVQEQIDRTGCLMALGGEETLDVGGFLAATYMRGIPIVHLPTTLVAQLDSCIGGKVALNHVRAKNLIGLLHHPRLAVVDVEAARASGARSIRAGLAEAVKYGVIADAELLGFLEAHATSLLAADGRRLAELVAWCLRIKARFVEEDEVSAGRRMLLNYGHTFGYAIEASTGFHRYTHGEAVAIGMTLAARVAAAMGLAPASLEARQTTLLRRFGLPCDFSGVATARLVEALWRDKKRQGDSLRFVLPTGIGHGEVRGDVPIELVARVLRDHATPVDAPLGTGT